MEFKIIHGKRICKIYHIAILAFISFVFLSCNDKNMFKGNSTKKIVISRYLAADWENLNTIELDSTGLFFVNNSKKETLDDSSIYYLLKHIDTLKINNFIECIDTVENFNSNEYLYKITIEDLTYKKSYNVNEIYKTNCCNGMMDSIRDVFIKSSK